MWFYKNKFIYSLFLMSKRKKCNNEIIYQTFPYAISEYNLKTMKI